MEAVIPTPARSRWVDLPPAIQRAIEARTGPVRGAWDAPDVGGALAVVVDTWTQSMLVRGARFGDQQGRDALRAEAAVAALELEYVPALRWRAAVGTWDLLATSHVSGRLADLSPGSDDVTLLGDVLRKARGSTVRGMLPEYADRWSAWATRLELDRLRGSHLLHTCMCPEHVLVSHDRATVVDWGRAARGPAWVDAAYALVQLVEAGHRPDAALRWVRTIPAWSTALPGALAAWGAAHSRYWAEQPSLAGRVEIAQELLGGIS